ncbi:MAG TPA: TIGR03668 family PPOX class F420-dependent oxidoreductase [Acidimicrobiia bacterium]|nr:TIGR03668 family PPOX class F420-dependent oxidoreductase [Acidimicrobiia bacterium]
MTLRDRAEAAVVARFATVDPDGRPHLVPCCFAFDGDVAYFVVDHKPKRSPALRRLDNIRNNPSVCLLVDHYEDDWSRLWWVRFDGRARVLEGGPEHAAAIGLLSAKYEQYRATPQSGTVVAIDVVAVRSWSASGIHRPTDDPEDSNGKDG